jgi:hypothetical protein
MALFRIQHSLRRCVCVCPAVAQNKNWHCSGGCAVAGFCVEALQRFPAAMCGPVSVSPWTRARDHGRPMTLSTGSPGRAGQNRTVTIPRSKCRVTVTRDPQRPLSPQPVRRSSRRRDMKLADLCIKHSGMIRVNSRPIYLVSFTQQAVSEHLRPESEFSWDALRS